MRVTKKLLLGSVVATAALVLAACAPQATTPGGDASETPTGPAQVTVGIVTSETGPLASYGKQYLDGFKAGLDYATDGTNEIDGTAITVEYKDDAGDPDKAVTAVKELIGAGVNIIGGSASSGVALAVAEQAAQNKVLFVSGPAAADAITGINEYTFRSGRQSAQDVATAGTFLDDLEGKTITVFAQNSAFGQGNEAAVKAILGGEGRDRQLRPGRGRRDGVHPVRAAGARRQPRPRLRGVGRSDLGGDVAGDEPAGRPRRDPRRHRTRRFGDVRRVR